MEEKQFINFLPECLSEESCWSLKKPTQIKKMEMWKLIKNTKDFEISSEGRVRRVTDKGVRIMALMKDKKPTGYKNHIVPYLKIALRQKDNSIKIKRVHRLVAENFCNKISKEHKWVDHINRNPFDNTSKNLRWVTPSESGYNRVFPKIDDYVKLVLEIIKKDYYKGKLNLIKKIKEIRK